MFRLGTRVSALRADSNECVRHTAALALQRDRCCTPKTIEALTICVSAKDADGNPIGLLQDPPGGVA